MNKINNPMIARLEQLSAMSWKTVFFIMIQRTQATLLSPIWMNAALLLHDINKQGVWAFGIGSFLASFYLQWPEIHREAMRLAKEEQEREKQAI